MAEVPCLMYIDQGVLSFFSKNHDIANMWIEKARSIADEHQFEVDARFVYSQANFWDLKNARYYDRELEFLENFGALKIQDQNVSQFEGSLNPFDAFEACDRSIPNILGDIFSLVVGGGPDISLGERALVTSEKTGFLSEMIVRQYVEKEANKLNEIDNEKANKRAFLKAFHDIPKMQIGESLARYLDRQDEGELEVLKDVFPSALPDSVEERVVASLMLNLIVPNPAKGIRSLKTKPSENEVVDAYHISYALNCGLFLTFDKGTAEKYKMLSKYWEKQNSVCLFEKVAS